MWEETTKLEEIVVETARLSHNSGSLHLHEKNQDAILKDVYIDNVSLDGITVKADCHAESFFKKNYGNKRCDYIILSEVKNKRIALFLDMKSSSLSNADVIECYPHDLGKGFPSYVAQLRSSSCFFDFLHSVLNDFCSCDELKNYPKRTSRFFVVLHSKKIAGMINDSNQLIFPIPPTRPSCNNTPETALVLYAENESHLNFESLILSGDE